MAVVVDAEILDTKNRVHVHCMVDDRIVPIHQNPYLFDSQRNGQQIEKVNYSVKYRMTQWKFDCQKQRHISQEEKFFFFSFRILPMPRHCVEPGAVIRHAAPLTVTRITPTPNLKKRILYEKLNVNDNVNHVKDNLNWISYSTLTSQWV